MSLGGLLNVHVRGADAGEPIVFLHGFGCGQSMWRHVGPAFEETHRVVLLDLPGSGAADRSTYDARRHASLAGYRDDVATVLRELDLGPAVVVGHSVSAMIGVLLRATHPDLVRRLVLVAPSARYLDDDATGYVGGFGERDIDDLLQLMSRNHLGWQNPLAGMVSGQPGDDVATELEHSFCRMDPEVAAQFAEVTFRGDNRSDLLTVDVPTLVIQSARDTIAPLSAGEYVAEAIPGARLQLVDTSGHCPHLSAPEATTTAIRRFVGVAVP